MLRARSPCRNSALSVAHNCAASRCNRPRLWPVPHYSPLAGATVSLPVALTTTASVVQDELLPVPEDPAAATSQASIWDKLSNLSCVFDFEHIKSSCSQQTPSLLIGRLPSFEAEFNAAVGQDPSLSSLGKDLLPAQLSHTQATAQLLTHPGPGLHIEWLPDSGCALLPLVPPSAATLQPGHVTLHLVAPDGWTFYMPSNQTCSHFTSGHSKASCLWFGSRLATQYSSLISFMHQIIRQQNQQKAIDRKGGTRWSFLQQKPALVQWVGAAALLEVEQY